jgi:hypothetical protein
MTTGVLAPEAHISISCIKVRPCADVAVNVLAPVWDAVMHAAIAECSLSTFIYCVSISPFATNSAIFSTTLVCGVIGYAAIT